MTLAPHAALPPPRQPQHHLTDDLVFRYAAGLLDEAVSLVVAAHIALCPACKALLDDAELLGGNLLEELPGESVTDDSWQRVLAKLDTPPASRAELLATARQSSATDSSNMAPLFPAPLRPYLKAGIDQLPWRRLTANIRDLELIRTKNGATARLLYFAAGISVFEHTHKGIELTLTLQGSYRSNDREFKRGDFEFADQETLHHPMAGIEADCICLYVTDAPLRFKNLLGRLMQPLIGI